VIELERGERLAAEPISGDHARWIIGSARTGRGGSSTLVIVKPKACDISTNLVLSTDRRIYELDLDAPPCKGGGTNPKQGYTRHVRFEYPDDSVRTTRGVASASSTQSNRPEPVQKQVRSALQPDTTAAAIALNNDYRIVRARRGPGGILGEKPVDYPWVPVSIKDDGVHVFITLPVEAKQHAAPVLYAVEDDGSRTMMNFAMHGDVIVTDRIFRRGLFVLASGNEEKRLEFENRSWKKSGSAMRRQ
jgi:type IV secretion system protein TrbG